MKSSIRSLKSHLSIDMIHRPRHQMLCGTVWPRIRLEVSLRIDCMRTARVIFYRYRSTTKWYSYVGSLNAIGCWCLMTAVPFRLLRPSMGNLLGTQLVIDMAFHNCFVWEEVKSCWIWVKMSSMRQTCSRQIFDSLQNGLWALNDTKKAYMIL